jgi:hypothetical protein
MRAIRQVKLHKSSTTPASLEPLGPEGNLLRLVDSTGLVREITNPKIGSDFILGTLEDNKTLLLIRKNYLRSVSFAFSPEDFNRAVSLSPETMGEQLRQLSYPLLANLYYLDQKSGRLACQLLGYARSFLSTDSASNQLVPIAAIGYLEIAVDNLS